VWFQFESKASQFYKPLNTFSLQKIRMVIHNNFSDISIFSVRNDRVADLKGRTMYGVYLRTLGCWDCGFECLRGHGCLSLVNVVCCLVEVSAKGWSLVQRRPTECGVSECDREASIMRRPSPTGGCRATKKKLPCWPRSYVSGSAVSI
jgi:hypothetical protein